METFSYPPGTVLRLQPKRTDKELETQMEARNYSTRKRNADATNSEGRPQRKQNDTLNPI